MLRKSATPPSTFPDFMSTKLSTTANNWIRYSDYWKVNAVFNYGDSGKAIRLGRPIPLKFPPPNRNTLFVNSEGLSVPNHFVYKRELPATEEAREEFDALGHAEKSAFLIDCPLTDAGQAKFDRDTTASTAYINQRIIDDNAQHAVIALNISDASLAALRLHDGYVAYLTTDAPWDSSLLYYNMLADIHQYGDASTKYHRTSSLILGKHDPATQSFDEWTNWLNEQFAQFRIDFESADQPGYFHCGEFKSFLFLQGTDRTMFRTVYDEQLRATPTGRFKDSDALIKLFQNYHRSHAMSMSDPISAQGGSAYPAMVKQSSPAVNSAPTQDGKRTKAFSQPCPHCLRVKKMKHHGHDPAICSNNPDNAKANSAKAAPQPPAPTIVTPQQADPHAIRLDRIEQSIESLVGFFAQSEPTSALFAPAGPNPSPHKEAISARLDRIENLLASFVRNFMPAEESEA